MRPRNLLLALLCLGYALVGCAGSDSNSSASNGGTEADAAASLDEGARAGDSPVDAALAEQGDVLFKEKGCTACHAFGQQLSGPDLSGVAGRRTNAWLETQILRPDEMAKTDPIARGLIAKHALQMPNQGLTADEAKAVIEFLKSQEASTASPE